MQNLLMRPSFLSTIVLLLSFLAVGAAEPVDIEVRLRTDPSGALVRRGLDIVGRTDQTVRFRTDDQTNTLKLVFEIDGHKPTERTILINDLRFRDVYPPLDQSPIILVPRSRLGAVVVWLKRHPAIGVSILALCLLGFITWRARAREAQALKRWLQRMEHLLDGSRSLHSNEKIDSIWEQSLQLSTNLLVGDIFAASANGDGTFRILGKKLKEANSTAVTTLVEAAEENDETLLFENFQAARYDSPIPTARSGLVAICRSGLEQASAIFVLSERVDEYKTEHRELLALIAHQTSSALVQQRIAEQLGQQEKLAAIGQMAAGLAHELNNPLGALQLAVDSALDTVEVSPKTAKRVLGKASGAVARARTLNDNFLRFTGEASVSPKEELNLAELVVEVLEALEHIVDKLEVTQKMDSNIVVSANRHDFEVLMTNLILNAKDAMAESEKNLLLIDLKREESIVRLRVLDSGCGIDETIKNRIFEPFFSTKPLGSGWGLGLSVCRQIVKNHDGELQLEPRSSGGTTAVVELPC